MASFLSGPAAELVGAGMQAMGVGIPVGETCSKVIDGMRGFGLPVPPKNWFKSKQPEQRTPNKHLYDKLESHMNGMLRVLGPALELKNLVQNGCKSADRGTCRRGSNQSPKVRAMFYSPQNCSSGRCDLFDDRKPNSPEKKTVKRSCKNSRGDRGKRQRKPRDSSSDEDESCMYCSRSRSLRELPCGRLICSKCDKTGDHDLECKQYKKLTR